MKIQGMNGEFAYQAIWRDKDCSNWTLSGSYFFSAEDVKKRLSGNLFTDYEFKWPVEMIADGVVYIPSQEEIENK